jgi:uncharacterized protein (UPF0332 family)
VSLTAVEYFEKADRALSAARLLLENSEIEGACNRAYYAMFDAAQAALMASGVSVPEAATKTHRGLIGAFGLHLVKSKQIASEFGGAINKVERLRRLADYTGELIELEDAMWAVQQAEAFVSAMRAAFMRKRDPLLGE